MSSLPDRMALAKSKTAKRKRGNKRPKTTKGQLVVLSKKVSKMEKENKPEVKNLYTFASATGYDNNGQILVPINAGIAQGTDVSGRVGRDVRCAGIDFRYQVYASVATANAAIRVIMYIDKDNSNTAISDLLYAGVGYSIGTDRAPMSFYNRNNRGTFTILYDKLHEFDLNSGSLQQYEHVKLKTNHVTRFIDNTTTITENAIRIALISDKAISGLPIFTMLCSYYYSDI